MTGAPLESLDILANEDLQPLSFIYNFKTPGPLDQQQKTQLRIFEVLFEQITNFKSHQIFNETYIRVYIYI